MIPFKADEPYKTEEAPLITSICSIFSKGTVFQLISPVLGFRVLIPSTRIKLPEGGVDLVFSYVGYEDVLMPIVIDRREVITKNVYMKESTKLLEEVVVSAGRFEQKLSNVTVSMNVGHYSLITL